MTGECLAGRFLCANGAGECLAGSGGCREILFSEPAGSGETFAGHSASTREDSVLLADESEGRRTPGTRPDGCYACAGTTPCPASKIFLTVSIVSASAAVLSSR
jgi:hypothetical protein